MNHAVIFVGDEADPVLVDLAPTIEEAFAFAEQEAHTVCDELGIGDIPDLVMTSYEPHCDGVGYTASVTIVGIDYKWTIHRFGWSTVDVDKSGVGDFKQQFREHQDREAKRKLDRIEDAFDGIEDDIDRMLGL